ncbi:MAG: hypothetical protein GXY03_08625, partial [Solirubrobacterales bacterium]|nr:hypothetical protein [Solirubrobacterales bacterium]
MSRQRAVGPVAGRVRLALLAAVAALAALAVAPAASSAAALEFETITGAYQDPHGSGDPVRQAGAHPDVTFRFTVPPDNPDVPVSYPIDQPHRLIAGMPPGLVGNPQAVATCPESLLKAGPNGNSALCPAESQVGVAAIISPGGSMTTVAPVYNLQRPADAPALFAFNYLSVVTKLQPSVRAGDFGIDIDSGTISQGLVMIGAEVTLWGVPFDPSHDAMRPVGGNLLTCIPGFGCFGGGQAASGVPRPFLSLPTECSGEPLVTTGLIDGWRTIGEFGSASFDTDSDGQPFVLTGCDELAFDPEVTVAATATATDAPSGLDVELRVPQTDAVNLPAAAHVKDVRMTLPEGFTVSPSSAVGLGACSSAQIDLGSNAEPACPQSSKLGTIAGQTPLLDEQLTGDVILATPDDNPFDSLIALYLVVRGPGVLMKIPGEVEADPTTGRLTATFENNPQLPFSSLRVRFDGGENASLASPLACGRYETAAGISSWSGKARDLTSPLVVSEGCGPRGFDPGFVAGSANPVAGGSSAFSLAISRPDRTAELSTLESLKLPEGLLGYVSKVDVCADAQADAGTCGAGSRIGHVQVAAGPGGAPVWVPQEGKAPTSVSLAGPYKGAPYSLSVVVPAQAGPFDLGRVVARSPLHIDRVTAQLSTGIDVSRVFDRKGNLSQTVQGGMPTIVEGIPLRLRELRVVVDRDGFTVNPTSCEATSVDATLKSVDGQSSDGSSRFQVGECASLGFAPKLGMRLLGKRQTSTGKHPALRTVLTQP